MMEDQRFVDVLAQAPNFRIAGLYKEDELDQFQGVADPTKLPQSFWLDLEKLKKWTNANAPDVAEAGGDSAMLTPIGMSHPVYVAVENIESGNWALLEYRPFSFAPWALGVSFVGIAGALLLKTTR